jgi:hypothetical protein
MEGRTKRRCIERKRKGETKERKKYLMKVVGSKLTLQRHRLFMVRIFFVRTNKRREAFLQAERREKIITQTSFRFHLCLTVGGSE